MIKPDNLEKGIRIGCGGVVGILLGALTGTKLFLAQGLILYFVLTIVIAAVVSGILALKLGDRFWDFFK